MKILFISENYPPYIEGGAEISTSLLASYLAKEHNVSVTCSKFTDTPWNENGVEVYPIILKLSLGTKNAFSAIKYAVGIIVAPIVSSIRVLRLIKKLDPDVINIVVTLYYFIPIILAIKLFSGRPIFIDCRDYSLICPLQFKDNEIEDPKQSHHGYQCFLKGYQVNNSFLRLFMAPFALYESFIFNLYKSTLRYAINNFKGITLVPLSHYVQDQLILNGFHKDKTVAIPNIAKHLEKTMTVPKASIPTFVYGGRIEKEKGIWDLVAAAKMLKTEIPSPFVLKIAGMGSEFEALQDYVKKNNLTYITILGQIEPSKVLALYQEAWAIVAPSRWPEPFGRFIQESITTGTPVIATRAGGITEGVLDGVTGILVEIGNVEQLKNAMEYFIKNPEQSQKMGAGMMAQAGNYEASFIAEKRLALYQATNR